MEKVRMLPHDLEAEKALLSGCFIRPEIIGQIQLVPTDFYPEKHQIIWGSMQTLGRGMDIITLEAALRASGKLEAVGGIPYLGELHDTVSTSAGWKAHSEIIREHSQRRQVITACQVTADKAFAVHEPLEDTLSTLKEGIRTLESGQAPEHLSNYDLMDQIQRHLEKEDAPQGPKTGFLNLDKYLYHLEPGTTIYLAARPSIGKTALGLNILENVSTSYPGTALFFSLEMTAERISRRRVAMDSQIYLSKIRNRTVDNSQWPDLLETFDRLSKKNPMILDSPKYKTIEILYSKAETVAMNGPISMIMVDHLQKTTTRKRTQSRHHELSFTSERLCDLGKDLGCPVVVLCQLSRKVEERNNKRPILSDLKESGDIEQNADVVLSLYRKDKEDPWMEVECLKARDGEAGWKTMLEFERFTQRIYDTDRSVEKQPLRPTDDEEL